MPIKVAITDDHPMVVTGLQTVLASEDSIIITHSYTDGHTLLEGIQQEQPDVLLLDLQLPDILGKDLAETILRQFPDVRIIILTSLEATYHIEEMMQLGCMGYLLKSNTDHKQLIRAIEQVYNGEMVLDEGLQKQFLTNIKKKKKQQADSSALLTRREREVLKLIVEENTNQEIAVNLHVSIRTVECHRLSLLHKLMVKNTAGLVKKAMELRLL